MATSLFGQSEPLIKTQTKVAPPHSLQIRERKKGCLTGVTDVLSFDEESLVLDTELGLLRIVGKDLHVSRLHLESGEVDFEGEVVGLQYQERGTYRKAGESLWKRLLS